MTNETPETVAAQAIPAKPRACESCGHRTAELRLHEVKAPPAVAEEARAAGIATSFVMWLCVDPQACLRRSTDAFGF